MNESQKQREMKVKMTLISKGIRVEKICSTKREVYVFERDMPAKHGLLFSNTPYVIGKVFL